MLDITNMLDISNIKHLKQAVSDKEYSANKRWGYNDSNY